MISNSVVLISVHDDQGCSLDFTLQLTIEDCSSDPPPITGKECQAMFPNAFSPNDDGFNDRFQSFFAPECEPITYNLMIFNRWGNQLYESTNPGEGWDGTFRGELHPQEVLVYICQISFPDGTSQEIKGDVVLIR